MEGKGGGEVEKEVGEVEECDEMVDGGEVWVGGGGIRGGSEGGGG